MKFCWCTLTVSDLDASVKFYRDVVGLSVQRRFPAGPGVEIAFMGEGETTVELYHSLAKTDTKIGPDVSLGFVVDSLDATMNMVRQKGITIQGGPFQPTPNIRFFYIQDPDGMKIQFVENC